MIKKIELDFGVVWIHNKILISELNEGVLLDVDNNRRILDLGNHYFQDENFGYISNRINSYAVNPLVYRESAEHSQLKAIAVVSEKSMVRESARIEQQFFTDKNCFKIFSSLEDAKTWMAEILQAHSKEKSFSE